MRPSRGPVLLAIALALVFSAAAAAGEGSAFERMAGQYEEIRQALLHDSVEGTAEAAGIIRGDLQALEEEFSEQAAGIRAGEGERLRDVLPAIGSACTELAEATTIADARKAFGKLSKAMVRYRRLVADPAGIVAFCAMAQQVWLQPEGEIGNPYYGQAMAGCGEIVSE